MSDGAKLVFAGLAGLVGIVLVFVMLHLTGVYVIGGVQRETADYRGETDKIEKTLADGDYRISSYELFFDRCAEIQSKQQNLKNLEEQLKTADDEDKTWLNQTIVGVKAGLADDISSYNADAMKEGTKGQFRDSRLPYHIDLDERETTCGS